MLSKSMLKTLNDQIEKEAYSSQLYLAMATFTNSIGYSGVAKWLFVQSEEERMHMMRIINYISERGDHAIVPALKQPPTTYGNMQEIFNDILKHEQYITDSINQIVAATIEEKDYTTQSWIQWFVNEQIEEEAQVQEIIDKLKLLGKNNLYMFDRDILSMRESDGNAEK